MEIPKYLKDALYQFSEDVLAERDHSWMSATPQ
jgi:hypothetical protein